MDIQQIKDILYDGFIAVRNIDGVPFKTKHRMLWEMFALNGENHLHWKVVGITQKAYEVIKANDYKRPIGNKDSKVNRAHISNRIDTSRTMLEGPLMNKEQWWQFYRDNDRCVLATGTENMSKQQEVIKYAVPDGLFESYGFSPKWRAPEIEFLKNIS